MNLRTSIFLLLSVVAAHAQSIAIPWTGHGHDAQHTGISKIGSQPMQRVKWQMVIDLAPNRSGTVIYGHYAAPLVTRQNTVVVPMKTAADSFQVEGHDPADGTLKWTVTSDYSLPDNFWTPPFGIALTPKNRVYFPGGGGTVLFRDSPDATSGATGRLAFYGMPDPAANVKINTPITADRYGNIFFGFQVTGTTAQNLESGMARIGEDGAGSWVSAKMASNDTGMDKVLLGCAPALSNDGKKLYFAVNETSSGAGYLIVVDSSTLAPIGKVRLKDAQHADSDALLSDNGTASPTIGPDGDVYFGVLENPFGYNNFRGWLLHFDSDLTQTKTAGAFGWDDTPSVVPASLVPPYHGPSEYLLLTKYNNYAGYGTGDGHNKIAVLDPNVSMSDPVTGAPAMNEVLTILSPTLDDQGPNYPDARREWCINMAAIDPARKSALVSCEDGKTYRWDFPTNSFTESITLTDGIGEAYTPTAIGVDGTIYAIANATLFAIGAGTP